MKRKKKPLYCVLVLKCHAHVMLTKQNNIVPSFSIFIVQVNDDDGEILMKYSWILSERRLRVRMIFFLYFDWIFLITLLAITYISNGIGKSINWVWSSHDIIILLQWVIDRDHVFCIYFNEPKCKIWIIQINLLFGRQERKYYLFHYCFSNAQIYEQYQ